LCHLDCFFLITEYGKCFSTSFIFSWRFPRAIMSFFPENSFVYCLLEEMYLFFVKHLSFAGGIHWFWINVIAFMYLIVSSWKILPRRKQNSFLNIQSLYEFWIQKGIAKEIFKWIYGVYTIAERVLVVNMLCPNQHCILYVRKLWNNITKVMQMCVWFRIVYANIIYCILNRWYKQHACNTSMFSD